MTAALAGQRLSNHRITQTAMDFNGPACLIYSGAQNVFGQGVVFHTKIWYYIQYGIQYGFCYVMRRDLRPERYWEERYDDPRHPVSFGIALPYQGR